LALAGALGRIMLRQPAVGMKGPLVMPDGLYERDTLAWSVHQAALLRRLAAGERLNEAVDWPHIIEEVESVGRSELRACESLLRQALLHLLKMQAWPGSRSARHWRAEARGFLFEAARAFSPSMRQRIDVAGLYRSARQQVLDDHDDAGPPAVLPDHCAVTLDGLLAGDVDDLSARLCGG